ncbi:MAG: heat-inducible transcriptional repressor HrcA [Bacilli bacterium]
MLSHRQTIILQVIVDDFIRSAQPVGSRALAKREEIMFSPATIRNEMADLEDFGFIEKTHTSSGRVPSEKGYRYYVDHMLAPSQLSEGEIIQIESRLRSNLYEKEKMLQSCSNILSELTNYTAVVIEGARSNTRLERLEIVPVPPLQVVAILVTNRGEVLHQMINLPHGVEASDLEKTAKIINERMHGKDIAIVQEQLRLEVLRLIQRHVEDYDMMVEIVRHLFSGMNTCKPFSSGQSKILAQPEFQVPERIEPLLSLFENKEQLSLALNNQGSDYKVTIGQENTLHAMQHCSLITAQCHSGDEQIGTLAVIGPVRMDYNRVVTIINSVKVAMKDLHK